MERGVLPYVTTIDNMPDGHKHYIGGSAQSLFHARRDRQSDQYREYTCSDNHIRAIRVPAIASVYSVLYKGI